MRWTVNIQASRTQRCFNHAACVFPCICFGAWLRWLRWKKGMHVLGFRVVKQISSANVLAFQWVIPKERKTNGDDPIPVIKLAPVTLRLTSSTLILIESAFPSAVDTERLHSPGRPDRPEVPWYKKNPPSPIAHYGVPYFPVLCIPHRQEEIMSRSRTFDLSLWSNLKWPNGLAIFQSTVLCHTCRDREN